MGEKLISPLRLQFLFQSKGLKVVGARPGMGVTTLLLTLAGELAADYKVLFISYQDCKENLTRHLARKSGTVPEGLTLNSSLPFYCHAFFVQLEEMLLTEQYDYLILDNLQAFVGEENELDQFEKDIIIRAFAHLSRKYSLPVILALTLSALIEKRGGDRKPMIRDFIWGRQIINLPHQVISLYRPGYYGVAEDEAGNQVSKTIEISCLKNDSGYTGRIILPIEDQ